MKNSLMFFANLMVMCMKLCIWKKWFFSQLGYCNIEYISLAGFREDGVAQQQTVGRDDRDAGCREGKTEQGQKYRGKLLDPKKSTGIGSGGKKKCMGTIIPDPHFHNDAVYVYIYNILWKLMSGKRLKISAWGKF